MTAVMPGGIIPGGQVHGIWTDSTEGGWSPSADYYITEGINWLECATYLPCIGHHLKIDQMSRGLDEWWCWSHEDVCSRCNLREATNRRNHDEPIHMKIWRAGEKVMNATSQCLDPGSEGGPGYSQTLGIQKTETSWCFGQFSVELKSVQRLDCLTSDGNLSQTWQHCRETIEQSVCIELAGWSSLWLNLATPLGRGNNSVWRRSSFCTFPGCSFWGPQQSHQQQPLFPSETPGSSRRLWRLW
jgi:hypothetical protein